MSKTAKKKAKASPKKILITVAVILAILIVVGLVVLGQLNKNGFLTRAKTAISSDNFKITGTMMQYFYNTQVQSYADYFEMLGIDSSKSLKSQPCTLMNDGSWYDYFMNATKNYGTQLLALCEGAKEAGVELTAEDRETVEENIKTLEQNVSAYGYTLDSYLSLTSGAGVNRSDVRACMELGTLAQKFSEKFTADQNYTSEDYDAYYNEHTEDFMGVDYYTFKTEVSDFLETDESGNLVGDTAAASADAKEAADKIAAATSLDEFKELIVAYATEHGKTEEEANQTIESGYKTHALASSIADVADWAFEAKEGDITVSGAEGDTAFPIYYITKASYRDETVTRDVRHVLFTDPEEGDTETESAMERCDAAYAEWEEAGFTEEAMKELSDKYNEDSGGKASQGLYENVAPGTMASTFNDWLFDEARKPGDYGMIQSTYGWHLMYYVGEGDYKVWEQTADEALKDAAYEAMMEKGGESVKAFDDVIKSLG